jgi:hypothetical protein
MRGVHRAGLLARKFVLHRAGLVRRRQALAPPAVAAAFFDATGVPARRIPLIPAYVKTLLNT